VIAALPTRRRHLPPRSARTEPLNNAGIDLTLPPTSNATVWKPYYTDIKKYGGDLASQPPSQFASARACSTS
jgi:hypothetical protein